MGKNNKKIIRSEKITGLKASIIINEKIMTDELKKS